MSIGRRYIVGLKSIRRTSPEIEGLIMDHLKKAAMDKSVTATGYIASISTALGGFFSLNNIALMLGIISTIVLTIIQYRRYRTGIRMDKEYHQARMAALQIAPSPNIVDKNNG